MTPSQARQLHRVMTRIVEKTSQINEKSEREKGNMKGKRLMRLMLSKEFDQELRNATNRLERLT